MLPLVVLALVVVVVIAILVLGTHGRGRDRTADRPAAEPRRRERAGRMPAGADAALWSIVEAVPDPRNHLALTRDLTGEVRVTGTPLDPARRATRTRPTDAPTPTPPATASPAAAVTPPGRPGPAAPTVSDSGEHLVLPGAQPRPQPTIALESLDQVSAPRDGRDGGGRLDRAS